MVILSFILTVWNIFPKCSDTILSSSLDTGDDKRFLNKPTLKKFKNTIIDKVSRNLILDNIFSNINCVVSR